MIHFNKMEYYKSKMAYYNFDSIQFNNHLVKRSLIETPLRERLYSSQNKDENIIYPG